MSRRNTTTRSSVVRKSIITLAALTAAPAVLSDRAYAANLTWDANSNTVPDPSDGAGSWDTTLLNWYNGTTHSAWNNANNDVAVFGAGGAGGAVTLPGAVTIGGLSINVSGYNLSGGTLTLGTPTPVPINIADGVTATIGSVISGAGPVTYTVGNGATLNLSGANVNTGGATITGGGTVDLGGSGLFGASGNTYTLNNINIRYNNARTLNQNFEILTGTTSTIYHTGGGTTDGNGTISGNFTGGGTLIISAVNPAGGGRTWSHGGNNSAFTGTFLLATNGNIRFVNNNAGAPQGVYNLQNVGTIQSRQGTATIGLGAVIGGANTILRGSTNSNGVTTYSVGGVSSLTLSNAVFGGSIQDGNSAARTTAILKVGPDTTWTLGGNNTYTGPTTIDAGTIALGATGTIGTSQRLVVNSGGAFNASAVSGGYVIPANQIVNGSGGTIYGNITSNAATQINAGTIGGISTLNFANDVIVSGGELRFEVGSGTSDLLNITGGLALNSGSIFIAPFSGLSTGDFTLANFNAASLSGSVSNMTLQFGQRAIGTINTATPGQLRLNISSIGSTGIMNWNGTANGTWNLSGEQNWFNTNTAQQDAFFAGDTVNFLDGVGLTTDIEKVGLLEPAAVNINTSTLVYDIGGSGTITGAAAVTKNGTSTVIFSSANNFTGGTTINTGTVVSGNSGAMGSGSILLAGSGAAFMMTGGITHGSATTGTININADNAVIGGNGTLNTAVNTFNTPITVSVPTTGTTFSLNATAVFTHLGAGPITLTATDQSLGSIRFTGTHASWGGVDWNLGNSSVSMFNRDSARNIPLGSLAGGPNTQLRGNASTGQGITTFTIGGGNINSTTFAGRILDGTVNNNTGTVALVKGNGTLTLTGANTYTGTTTVNNGGTLIVNGSHTGGGGAYTVNGALGGSGVISSAVSVADSATLSPGASVGVLTVGSLALAGGSNINAEFGSAGGDGVIVTNSVGASVGGTVNVNMSSLGGAIAGQYPLIDFDGAGPTAASFTINGSVGALTPGIIDNAAGSSVDVLLTGAGPVHAMWNVNSNGDWSTGGNWSPSSPNGVDFQAYFGSIASAPIAVNVDSAKTVSQLHFNSTSAYTLSGSGITLNSTTGSAGINVLRGSHTIGSAVTMSQPTTVHVGPAASVLTVSGNVGGSVGLTKQGAGELVLSGANNYSGTTSVNAGVLRLNGTHSGGGAYSVATGATIGGSGTTASAVTLASGARLAPGASVGVLTVGSLSLSSSILDIEVGSGSADRVVVTSSGGLTLSGISVFNLLDAGGITTGQFPLIDYSGSPLVDLSNFSLALTELAGFDVSLVNNTANTSVDLSVIGAIISSWAVDADGNWGDGANWTANTVPNAIDATANFGTVITATRTVTVNAAQTVGSINFSSPIAYNVAGSSTLTMDVGSGGAGIDVTAGAHTISAPIVLNDNLTVTSAASTGVNLSGNLTATGRTITKAGAGSVQFANVRASSLAVNDGVARIAAGGTANLAGGTSVVQSYSIGATGQLDLTNNSMIVDYTGAVGTLVDDTRQHLANTRLTSSSATGLIGLGYADNDVLDSEKSEFGGQSVDASSLLIKFTYFGDSDLDGDVDVADLGKLATSWQTANVWSGGDFDYNGTVNVNDLGLLATNWQAGVGNPLGPDSLSSALASLGLPSVAVPEPASMGLLGALGAWSLKRPVRRMRRATR
jgi:autotransporter-associated beta strand protein